jgi:dTDP-glucose 4,6-dehydratase/UDP-glucose 4-epimerase
LFSSQQYDVCLNATGAANVQFSFQQPLLDYSLNVANVYYILDAIRRYNQSCKFINLSSAAVYGNPATLPVNELHVLRPISPYGWHKVYSEQICSEFFNLFGVPTISLRIFSAYGEGLKKQLLWDIYKKIQNSTGIIELFGTGNETRDFIYVADILKAVHCIIDKDCFEGQAVNVASGSAVTVAEVATILVSYLKPSIEVKFTSHAKTGDPSYWQADIQVLKEMGFSPEYTLNEGIKKYALWLGGIVS